MDAAAAARLVLEAAEAGRSAVVVVVAGDPAAPETVGRRVVVRDGEAGGPAGTLGDPAVDARALALAERVLSGEADEGLHRVTAGRRELELYAEAHRPTPELVIVGAGHIARPLCTVGALLGLRVVVLDDRPDFATRERFPEAARVERIDMDAPFAGVEVGPGTHVVLVTRGHRYDYECLRALLAGERRPGYIGMIGSRRRVRATWEKLVDEGFSRDDIARVRAPVGLDLGAETPAEIAVAVAAEIVLLWRGGSGRPLRDAERVLERFFPQGGDRVEGTEGEDA